MNSKMFCFQCEQTAGGKSCNGSAGVCGKQSDTATLQDDLTGELIGLARATDGNIPTTSTDGVMLEGLFATVTNVSFDNASIENLIKRVCEEKEKLVPKCTSCASRCGRNNAYNMNSLWEADEDIRSLKSLILFGLRGMAAYAYHARVLNYSDLEVNSFFYKGLIAIGSDLKTAELLPIVLELGEKNLKCMAMLDKAIPKHLATQSPQKLPLP